MSGCSGLRTTCVRPTPPALTMCERFGQAHKGRRYEASTLHFDGTAWTEATTPSPPEGQCPAVRREGPPELCDRSDAVVPPTVEHADRCHACSLRCGRSCCLSPCSSSLGGVAKSLRV